MGREQGSKGGGSFVSFLCVGFGYLETNESVDNAGNQFFRAWSESVDAMDILRDWLKAGATAKDDRQLEETIMPLLHVSFI